MEVGRMHADLLDVLRNITAVQLSNDDITFLEEVAPEHEILKRGLTRPEIDFLEQMTTVAVMG